MISVTLGSRSLDRFTLWRGLDVSHPFFGESRWAYKGVFAAHRMYGQSKLAQMYHARSVGSKIEVNIVNSFTQRSVASGQAERGQCDGSQPPPGGSEHRDHQVRQTGAALSTDH